MPSNPYSFLPDTPGHKVSGRVAPDDFQYIRRLFPFRNGIQDSIVSTLYKALCDELRRHNLDPTDLDTPAWASDHPTVLLLNRILGSVNFVERCASGDDSIVGDIGRRAINPRDVSRATGCVHPTLCYSAGICANPEGCTASREWRKFHGLGEAEENEVQT